MLKLSKRPVTSFLYPYVKQFIENNPNVEAIAIQKYGKDYMGNRNIILFAMQSVEFILNLKDFKHNNQNYSFTIGDKKVIVENIKHNLIRVSIPFNDDIISECYGE